MRTLEGQRVQRRLSALLVVVGLVLGAGKIYADSEPGLIPILLVVVGTTWHFLARARSRSRPE